LPLKRELRSSFFLSFYISRVRGINSAPSSPAIYLIATTEKCPPFAFGYWWVRRCPFSDFSQWMVGDLKPNLYFC
jgi:hypothetical protein